MDDTARIGTCDSPVTWNQKGVICETCDQWYHSSCQNIHSKTYEILSDSELNVSWHCLICNNANYTDTVHDLFSCEVSHSSSTIEPLSDISASSPDPTRYKIKPIHSSTPAKILASHSKLKLPLRVLNINFQETDLLVFDGICLSAESWMEEVNKSKFSCTERLSEWPLKYFSLQTQECLFS